MSIHVLLNHSKKKKTKPDCKSILDQIIIIIIEKKVIEKKRRRIKQAKMKDDVVTMLSSDMDEIHETPKKKLKSHLYKQPTVEELNDLRETENLFHSNIFRMQVSASQKKSKSISIFPEQFFFITNNEHKKIKDHRASE
jgi:hypothetical protein